jgi:hypothetical protein
MTQRDRALFKTGWISLAIIGLAIFLFGLITALIPASGGPPYLRAIGVACIGHPWSLTVRAGGAPVLRIFGEGLPRLRGVGELRHVDGHRFSSSFLALFSLAGPTRTGGGEIDRDAKAFVSASQVVPDSGAVPPVVSSR